MAFALHTFAVGDPLTAAQMNQHEDNFSALMVYSAKGDLAAGTGANALAKLTAGADYFTPSYLASKSNGVTTSPGPTVLKATGYQRTDTSAAEVDICSLTLPGGFLGTSNALLARMCFIAANNKGTTGTYTIKAYYGATSCTVTTPAFPTNANAGEFWVDVVICANNATNAQYIGLRYFGIDSAGAIVSGASSPATAAIDSTAAQTVKMTLQMSASHSSFLWVMKHAEILAAPAGAMA
jgi:hypothetical protein